MGTKAERQAARERVAAYHEARLAEIVEISRPGGVSLPGRRTGHGMITLMAQPHKGAREQILAPVVEVVATRLRELADQHATNVSQLSADLLAIAVGHPEAVRELDQEVLRFPIVPVSSAMAAITQAHDASRARIKVRVVEVVAGRLRELAAEHATNVSQVSADLLAIAVGHPDLVRDLHKEVMPLAM